MNTTLSDGLKILGLLAHAEAPRSLTEIAAELGIGKSKAHRLLQTLMEANYVFRPPGSTRYLASIRLWSLGSAILRHDGLRAAAASEMQSLMERTGESVHLSILEDLEIVYLHKVDSDHPVRAYSQIGGRMPAHLVATGKAMLAFHNEQVLHSVHERLARSDAVHVKPLDAFMQEMRQIRQARIALNRGEWREDVFGIAAPLVDHERRIVAAIGVSGPANRFKSRQIRHYSTLVLKASDAIAEKLFGQQQRDPWRP